jgi:hypothetical protein
MQEDINKFFPNDEWEIETDEGWRDFKGIAEYSKKKIFQVILDNGMSVNVSKNHGFIDTTGNVILACNSLGREIKTINGIHKVIEIIDTNKEEAVYDLVDVEKVHKYYTNGILSHNTHLIEEFWKSVYPIISASKKSKIFIASTANGVGNLFHKLYTGAENNETNWSCDKILWNEIPGRDEKWKADTIASLGSLEAWQQEFECLFLDAGEGSLTEDLYNRLMQRVRPPKFIFDEGSYLMWDEPTSEGIYVASVDTAEGVGADYSVVQIFDYRDLTNIKQVATFCSNTISPYNFTEKVHEILQHWGRPLVCIERNNCGAQVVDNLSRQYAYENIISWGASTAGRAKGQLGVIAHTNTKHKGVTNMRYWVNELDSVEICDVNLVKELKNFTRYSNGTWAAKRGAGYHDDRVMSLIWNLIILEDEIVQRYFEVVNYDKNRKPLQIKQFDFGIKYFIQPDNRFNKDENYDSAYPIIIGNAENQSSEFDQLTEMGYKPL